MINLVSFVTTGVLIISSVLIYMLKYKGELFSHFNFIAVTCFLVEVVGPIVWLSRGQTHYQGNPVMEFGAMASLYFCIGYLAFCITFFTRNPVGSNWVYERSEVRRYDDMNIMVIWGCYFLFFILYFFYLRLRGRSLLSQLTLGQQGGYFLDILESTNSHLWFLLISINSLATIAVLLLFYQKSNRWIVYVTYLITLLLTISSGRRHLMLDLTIVPVIVFSVLEKKRIKIWTALATVLVAYLLVSWIGAMRGVYRTGIGELSAFDSSKAFDAFMVNIEVFFPYFMFVGLGANYTFGGTYLAGILSLIPSVLFPQKVAILNFLKDSVNYRELTGDELFNRGGVADNLWCEGYKNFGLIGIILVFVVLAWAITKLRKKMYSETVSTVIVYALTITFLFQVLTRSFQNALQDAFGLFIPVFLIRVLTSGRISGGRHVRD